MARNEEKANSMLARYLATKKDSLGLKSNDWRSERRPYLATECKSLEQAEFWRRQVKGTEGKQPIIGLIFFFLPFSFPRSCERFRKKFR